VTATAVGVTRQTIDDSALLSLLSTLSTFEISLPPAAEKTLEKEEQASPHRPPLNLDGLVSELDKCSAWRFQEQADLFEWIKPLNSIDAALSYLIASYPALLLIGEESGVTSKKNTSTRAPISAKSLLEVKSIPASVIASILSILKFLIQLLKNATNKNVFNSIDSLLLLLSAADDDVSSAALSALAMLATPPMLHRQQAPELASHTTALHNANAIAHEQLLVLARGWGSRGSGLGLHTCVSYDDSQQSLLPQHAGNVSFDYLPRSKSDLVSITIPSEDIYYRDTHNVSCGYFKLSTAELFFMCKEQSGDVLPPQKMFALLAKIRLGRAFHTNATRVKAVEARLRALICVLHVYPTQDILAGYFQAQPELCGEIVDLLRPTISTGRDRVVMNAGSADADEALSASTAATTTVVSIPHSVLTLAIEALTALVARRDGSNGGLSPVAREAKALSELGVGKGQYLGLLPTLIRYSLASLNSFRDASTFKMGQLKNDREEKITDIDMDLDLDLGMAFLEATKPPALPLEIQEERSLEFTDAVLTLTSALVSVPSGTAALTDCGLIPALISTLAHHGRSNKDSNKSTQVSYSECLRKFITAQAVQILEGAIVTHNSALTAFHELNGVDLLVGRLNEEIGLIKSQGEVMDAAESNKTSAVAGAIDGDVAMEDTSSGSTRPLSASKRVLMFSIVNCLTVVFHQQEGSQPSGGAQLRKPELTAALMDIMDHVSSYGGVLASLTATLLSDVMNADPHVVHHVHSSGLAKSFLNMMMGKKRFIPKSTSTVAKRGKKDEKEMDVWMEPTLPPSSELIMALPNVLSALSLTEEGAKAVSEANPFPSLLAIFCSPQYAMPQSRCLLNDMTAIVGTGIDELMRHVPSLRPLGISALVGAVKRVVFLGKQLIIDEEKEDERYFSTANSTMDEDVICNAGGTPLENSRTCIMQYAFNISQLLEQVLQNSDHATPFINEVGLESLLSLHPLLLPSHRRFLAHVSCLSNPSVANLTHYTTTSALTLTIKSVANHYDCHKLIRKIVNELETQLEGLAEAQKACRNISSSKKRTFDATNDMEDSTTTTATKPPPCLFPNNENEDLNSIGILDNIPHLPLHSLPPSTSNYTITHTLSTYLRAVATTEWLVSILSAVIRTACQRSHDMNNIWGGGDRDPGWKAELCSDSFSNVVKRMTVLNLSSQIELSKIRTSPNFDSTELTRRSKPSPSNMSHPNVYRLRIVCQDGAVIRNGIEIDSCASVGNLEMGEVVEAFYRCINSCGLMRYRTLRGWVSEHTRGHGREPITEVLSIGGTATEVYTGLQDSELGKNRLECGIPDLCSVSTSVMSRLAGCQKNLLACLSRAVAQGIRSLPLPQRFATQVGTHAGKVIRIVRDNLQMGFEVGFEQAKLMNGGSEDNVLDSAANSCGLNSAGLAMYFGISLEFLQTCLYEEKRERRILNVPLLVSLLRSDGYNQGFSSTKDEESNSESPPPLPTCGFLGAIRYILKNSLHDFTMHAKKIHDEQQSKMKDIVSPSTNMDDVNEDSEKTLRISTRQNQRLSRVVSASLPPAITLLRRLTSRSTLISSHMSSVLSRMKPADLEELVGAPHNSISSAATTAATTKSNTKSDTASGQSLDLVTSSNTNKHDLPAFHPGQFARGLHCTVAKLTLEVWIDPRLTCAPSHVIYPIVSLVGEILVSLEEASKAITMEESSKNGTTTRSSNGGRSSGSSGPGWTNRSELQGRIPRGISANLPAAMSVFLGGATRSNAPRLFSSPFEPSEETITRLVEMGFSREHALEALESTESNRVEVAMEYALAHPPPSPGTVERRRAQREERRRQREERISQQRRDSDSGNNNQSSNANESGSGDGRVDGEVNDGVPASSAPPSNASADGSTSSGNDASASAITGTETQAAASASASALTMECDETNVTPEPSSSKEDDVKPPLTKELTDTEKEALRKNEVETRSAARATACLAAFRHELCKISLNIIEGGSSGVAIKEGTKFYDPIPSTPINTSACTRLGRVDDGKGIGDGEAEATTVVICHFLLDLCGRYPADRSKIVEDTLLRLRSHLTVSEQGSAIVIAGHESDLASLCHASVILLRALPRTRPLLLRFGLVGILISCLKSETNPGRCRGKKKDTDKKQPGSLLNWPRWISPALLLLDVMAQPTAAPVDNKVDEVNSDGNNVVDVMNAGCGPKGEYTRMCLEHKKQELLLSKTAQDIFAVINGKKVNTTPRKKNTRKSMESKKQEENSPATPSDQTKTNTTLDTQPTPTDSKNSSDSKRSSDSKHSTFPTIPCYTPLMPSEEAEMCMHTTLRIIRHKPKRNQHNLVPPGIVHSSLLLLARVLRSHKIALQCLKMGGVELLLSLPSQCRFAGNTVLVTVILRHMLEDESTLRTAMETEIRGTVTRLHRQQNRGSSSNSGEKAKISARAFVQAVTPLICRDPVIFLKAAATSVTVEPPKGDDATSERSRSNRKGDRVMLLSSADRNKNLKALNEAFGSSNSNCSSSSVTTPSKGSAIKRGRSQHSRIDSKGNKLKSPNQTRRSISAKRGRKDKKDGRGGTLGGKCDAFVMNGTPANHITCLLVTEMVKLVESDKETESKILPDADDIAKEVEPSSPFFLRVVDCLEVLADLVLAVPACAAAIHRYRPSSSNSIVRNAINNQQHALNGCPSPPTTAVSYLLHNVLPQPRSIQQKINADRKDKTDTINKKKSFMRVRVAQASARLLVALCARAGEGRRRVVSDLACALGGRCKAVPASKSLDLKQHGSESEMWALQTWGELCIGLAAPKSSGANQDNNSALSWEVVKLMLEYGVAHALMAGIQRGNLYHPLASGASGALLRPLEVFNRGSVVDTVTEMAKAEMMEKEETEKKASLGDKPNIEKPKKGSNSRRITLGPSQRSESAFADDAMLEEGFDPYTADRARQNARRDELRDMVEGMVHLGSDYDEEDEDNDEDDEDGEAGEEIEDEYESEGNQDLFSSSGSEDDSDENSDDDDEMPIHHDEIGYIEDEDSEDSDSEDDSSESSGSSVETSQLEDGEDGMDDIEDDEDVEDVADEDAEVGWGGEEDEDFFEGSIVGDDRDEVTMESELEDGWTRIESGFGGVLLEGQGGSSGETNSNRQRAGFVVDAAETMIGNILRGSDIQMEALAEIEDTLGIRISQHRGGGEFEASQGGRPHPRFGLLGASSASSGSIEGEAAAVTATSSGEGLNSRNRGTVGVLPAVQQNNFQENGHSGNGSRWNEISAVDYAFGDAAIAMGNDETSTQNEAGEYDGFRVPANVDTQLFPGGPAAATHTRSQQHLHSLLCDVELPAMNTMSSGLRPHGLRLGYASRGTGVSESNGGPRNLFPASSGANVLRLIRGPDGVPFLEHTARNSTGGTNHSPESRWTDDGQPLDSTTGDFSIAFEQALGETIARDTETLNDSNVAVTDSNVAVETNVSQSATSEANASELDSSQATTTENVSSQAVSPTAVDATNHQTDLEAPSNGADGVAVDSAPMDVDTEEQALSSGLELSGETVADSGNSSTSTNLRVPRAHSSEGNSSEGETVANSLAAGLNLSPRSDTSTVVSASMEDAAADASQVVATNTSANDSPNAQENMDLTDEQEDIQVDQSAQEPAASSSDAASGGDDDVAPNAHGFVCPPGMDLEVFNCLPPDMQQEVVEQHRATTSVADQLDSASGLDPEALAALPEDVRREVIEQEQQERRQRQQPPADPSNAEEMDNASFVASLAPDLREEILLTADDGFLGSLPPDIIAEAQILRERASSQHRRFQEEVANNGPPSNPVSGNRPSNNAPAAGSTSTSGNTSSRRRGERARIGKVRVDCDRPHILYMPPSMEDENGALISTSSMKTLVRLMYLLSPVNPPRLLQKFFQNLCANVELRRSFLATFVALLNGDSTGAIAGVNRLQENACSVGSDIENDFPPSMLIGTAPDVVDNNYLNPNMGMFRRRQSNTAAAAIAANYPASSRGSSDESLPPVVAKRIIETLWFLSKNSPRVCLEMLISDVYQMGESNVTVQAESCLDRLLDLISMPLYSKSSTNLEQLLNLLESVVAPLSTLPKDVEPEVEISKKQLDEAAAAGKEWVTIPRPLVAQHRLRSLCSVLRLESCKDTSFQKVNTIARRLCRVEANRAKILRELASVAQGLGVDSIRDLKSLSIQLNDAAKLHKENEKSNQSASESKNSSKENSPTVSSIPASALTMSTSSSELKLLRVLQTLHALCGETHDESSRKHDGHNVVTQELVILLQSIELESLWDELSSCLRIVSVLEGVAHEDAEEKINNNSEEDDLDADGYDGKQLQSSVAGLLTRFLPTIEAFFVVNASSTGVQEGEGSDSAMKEEKIIGNETQLEVNREGDKATQNDEADKNLATLVGGRRLVNFVSSNKVLLNALLRANPALLEKGLRAMVLVPQCRPFMDFDIKRQWFKTQVRRLRQHANRRHGSLRLNIRRKHVFEDAFHQLRLRNADEMRGRLHITFRNEEGVDAGGLSREFFAILAKEMFNPNYALFTSTEDGCTFQPNPNSNINPDHLSYFRFVGRIVGKAVVDGFLLDAHFTRSLYKHMLNIKPTHHDMQAIDPDYYKNLKMILEYKLADIGLELSFSTEDHSFGRSDTFDLIKGGRNIAVTEDSKSQYVSLVCQHRMTTAIERQIKAYLEGFHELVKPELISIFTAKELELLISGMPEIDMQDLQNNTEYQNYKPSDPQIIWFWKIMFSLTKSEKAAFLQFVTGSAKVPLEGFSQLQGMRGTQKFSIHRAGVSNASLVSAHTCFNALDLPVYTSEEEMREKILYAINEGAGGFLFA